MRRKAISSTVFAVLLAFSAPAGAGFISGAGFAAEGAWQGGAGGSSSASTSGSTADATAGIGDVESRDGLYLSAGARVYRPSDPGNDPLLFSIAGAAAGHGSETEPTAGGGASALAVVYFGDTLRPTTPGYSGSLTLAFDLTSFPESNLGPDGATSARVDAEISIVGAAGLVPFDVATTPAGLPGAGVRTYARTAAGVSDVATGLELLQDFGADRLYRWELTVPYDAAAGGWTFTVATGVAVDVAGAISVTRAYTILRTAVTDSGERIELVGDSGVVLGPVVPEPSAALLLGLGLAAVGLARRRRAA